MQTNSTENTTTVCRTCLQHINNFSQSHSLENQESCDSITLRYKLRQCIPELDLDAVPGIAICNDCFLAVNSIYDFKNKCLQAETKIKTYLGGMFSSVAFIEFTLDEQVQQTPSEIIHSGLLNENSQLVNIKMENGTDITKSPSLHCQNIATDETNAQIQQMQADCNIKAEYTDKQIEEKFVEIIKVDTSDNIQIEEKLVEIIDVDASDDESETTGIVNVEEGTNYNPNITSTQSEPKQNQNNSKEVNIKSNRELFNYESSPQHQCSICSCIFTTKASLIDHLVNCSITLTSKRISEHRQNSSDGNTSYKCVVCSKDRFPLRSLIMHMESHDPKKCKHYQNLRNGNSSDGKTTYTCVVCSKDRLFLNGLIMHIKSHEPTKLKKCNSCGYSTYYSAKLRIHKKSHKVEPTHGHLSIGNNLL